jgi:hypothetical protein
MYRSKLETLDMQGGREKRRRQVDEDNLLGRAASSCCSSTTTSPSSPVSIHPQNVPSTLQTTPSDAQPADTKHGRRKRESPTSATLPANLSNRVLPRRRRSPTLAPGDQ